MPRPNPPRKRSRRRPDATQRARAGAELTRQTAQSSQQKPPSTPKPASGGASVAATAPPEEMWSRRSYAILIGLIGATEVVIGVLLFALNPTKDLIDLVAEVLGLQPFQPFPLLAACLLAAPIAKRLSGEARSLRFVETIIAGVVIYLLFVLLVTAAGFVLSPNNGSSTSGACASPSAGVATPLPNSTSTASAAPSSTPCPSPAASPQASASPSASAGASPSPSASATVGSGSSLSPGEVVAAAGGANVVAYVLAIYIYPPLYKRLRVRPRPPTGGAQQRGGDRGKESTDRGKGSGSR